MARTPADWVGLDAIRAALEEMLPQLTPPQRELFDRIYGDTLRPEDLKTAYNLVHRTLKKNEKR